METWITQGGERIMLPITPFFEPKFSMNNEVINLNEIGSASLAGNEGLYELSINSFFPAQQYHFLDDVNVDTNPYFYIDRLESFMRSREPVRLLITETPFNKEMLINNFTWGESDGTRDVYYTIDLVEYKRIEQHKVFDEKTKQVVTVKKTQRFTSAAAVPLALATIGKYDTAWTMAKKLVGDGDKWQELLKKNKISLPSKLKEGMVLKP